MPKCPNCNLEIDYLRDWVPAWKEFKCSVGEDEEIKYEDVDNVCVSTEGNDDEYECPVCSQVLFRDDLAAEMFLKGRKDADVPEMQG